MLIFFMKTITKRLVAAMTFLIGSNTILNIAYAQPHFVALNLGFAFEGGSRTGNAPVRINNAGQIAFTVGNTNGNTVGFYSGGSVETFGAAGAYGAMPQAINNSGQIVGYFGGGQAFFYSDGVLNNDLLENGGFAFGINDSGVIVGDGWLPGVEFGQPFILANGNISFLTNSIGSVSGSAWGINNSGQVIVSWDMTTHGGPYTSFLVSGGNMTQLPTLPGGSSCQAYRINDSAEILGISDIGDGELHWFLYANSVMQDLTAAGFGDASDMNSSGEIVGSSCDGRPLLYKDGTTYNLMAAIVNSNSVSATIAAAINDLGQIVVGGNGNCFLLNPVEIKPLTILESGFYTNGFCFTVSSTPGLTVAIETSTNLVNWNSLGIVTNLTGTAPFVDPATNQLQRFYRLQQL